MKRGRKEAPPAGRVCSGAIRAQLTGSDTAHVLDVTVRGHAPILKLCCVLVARGHDPATPLEAYRAKILSLRIASVGTAARLTINSKGTGFAPSRAVRTAPPARVQRPPSSQGPATPKTHPKGPAHTNGEIIATRRATHARAETERKQRLAGDKAS